MISELKWKFKQLVEQHDLLKEQVEITTRPLDVREAIGEIDRDNLPLQTGNEVLIQADFAGCSGQAFTDHPGDFIGSLKELLQMDLKTNFERALLIAAINAITCYLGVSSNTVHCRNEDLEKCGIDIAYQLKEEYGEDIDVGIIGFQPVIIENVIHEFGADQVRVTDIDADKIGRNISGALVWDGSQYTEQLIAESDIVLATGSTVANDSLNDIVELINKHNKIFMLFGTTVAGPAALLGLNRICPRSY